jgi:hypothetical protein
MSKFLSGRVPEFKVGIVSYSENKTVLEVTGNAYALGNVGIGLTNPEYKLHIDGETRIGNQTSGSGGWFRVSLRDGTAAPAAATLTMRSSASSSEAIPVTQPNLVLNRGSDTLGTLLQFKNNRTGYAAVGSLAESNGGHDLRVYVGIGTEAIRVNSIGNVGIGTINPTSKLHVQGNVRVSGIVTTQSLNVSSGATINGLTYPITDGSNLQVITTDGSGNLQFTSVTQLQGFDWNADSDFGFITDNVTDTDDLELITESVVNSYDLGFLVIAGVIAPDSFILPSFTINTLPTADPAGQMLFVTDETGGSVPAFSDGTNWRRVTDRQIVS